MESLRIYIIIIMCLYNKKIKVRIRV